MRRARKQHGETAGLAVGSFGLPVSGAHIRLRPMTGEAELLLAERHPSDPALTLALLERLGEADPRLAWSALPVHDVDTLIVQLRQAQVGDRVVAEVTCGGVDCGQLVDLSFGLRAYLAHHRPRTVRGRGLTVAPCAEVPGWHRLEVDGTEAARFRLPTLCDQIAVAGVSDQAAALAARCIRPDGLSARARRRVEAAMEAIAPPLAGSLLGLCPECGAAIETWFDARLYCLQDLCGRARYVFDDVDVLAERYHWSERAILRLPCERRGRYAERARLARTA
jgi:hypothetical protein